VLPINTYFYSVKLLNYFSLLLFTNINIIEFAIECIIASVVIKMVSLGWSIVYQLYLHTSSIFNETTFIGTSFEYLNPVSLLNYSPVYACLFNFQLRKTYALSIIYLKVQLSEFYLI